MGMAMTLMFLLIHIEHNEGNEVDDNHINKNEIQVFGHNGSLTIV